MKQKISTSFTLFVFILLMIVGLWALTNYYAELPQHTSVHETIILGQNRYVPGSQAALRDVVRDSKDAAPLPGAEIQVSLQPADGGKAVSVFQGTTDSSGNANVSFRVPADAAPNQQLPCCLSFSC